MVSSAAGLTVLDAIPSNSGYTDVRIVIYNRNHFVIINILNILKTFIVISKYLLEYLFYLLVVTSSQELYVTLCNVYLNHYI